MSLKRVDAIVAGERKHIGSGAQHPHHHTLKKAILQWAYISRGVHLTSMYLIGGRLKGVHFTGVYLIRIHFIGVCLMGVYRIGEPFIGVHLMGVHLMRIHFIDV